MGRPKLRLDHLQGRQSPHRCEPGGPGTAVGRCLGTPAVDTTCSCVPPPRHGTIPLHFRTLGLQPTLTYDWAHHVVTADGRVFYASSGDDSVVCLNAADGSERWRFIAEGPFRTVPILSRDRVYAGSDDGWFYCLNAEDGAVVWRNRAGPGDMRLPGNGRMISQWPVRSAICIDPGVVIFGAGVFPNQGTLLRAVNAETGDTCSRQCIPATGQQLATSSRCNVPSGRHRSTPLT